MKALSAVILLCFSSVLLSAFDVKSCGAAGDGVADDSAALRKAVERLKSEGGGTLDFPAGTYRIGTVRGSLAFDGISNVKVNFAEGAVLLMDNPQADGTGGGHGMMFRAPAENIELNRVNIVWKTRPAKRSFGDGLRFEGFPEDGKTLKNIRLNDCRVEGSAQAGAVFMGCSDITVRNFTIVRSLADGLHFNACRRVDVDGVDGTETGDDTLAFVTYYSKPFSGKTGGVFALPDLGEWNNSGSKAVRVRSRGGRANGVRIAGAKDISISDVKVEKKSCGVIIDAGLIDKTHKWQYLPSRGIKLSDAEISACDTGFYVWRFNSAPVLEEFSRFGVSAERFRISGCVNDSVHLSGVSGVTLKDFSTSGCRWRFRTFRNCTVENADIAGAPFLVIGEAGNAAAAVDNNGVFRNLSISGGELLIQNSRKLAFENLKIADSSAAALSVDRGFDSSFGAVLISGANRSGKGGAAVRLLRSRDLRFASIAVSGPGSPAALVEIGGGNAELRSGNIVIEQLTGPEGIKRLLLQGGPYAPENCSVGGSR